MRRYATWGDEPFDQNIGAVLGRKGLVVIDTRASHRLADELRGEINVLRHMPIAAVINTHHHWDHTFGNARFLPSPIWGHARCAERVLDGDAMRARVISQAPQFADELNEVVLGVLGRAQRLYPIRICGLAVLSSHVHLLLDVDNAGQLAPCMAILRPRAAGSSGSSRAAAGSRPHRSTPAARPW